MFITILIHNEDGSWWAESPDVRGYSAAADTRDQLEALVVEGLGKFLGDVPNLMIAFRMADQAPVAAGSGTSGTITNTVATRLAGNQFGMNTSGNGAATLPQPRPT